MSIEKQRSSNGWLGKLFRTEPGLSSFIPEQVREVLAEMEIPCGYDMTEAFRRLELDIKKTPNHVGRPTTHVAGGEDLLKLGAKNDVLFAHGVALTGAFGCYHLGLGPLGSIRIWDASGCMRVMVSSWALYMLDGNTWEPSKGLLSPPKGNIYTIGPIFFAEAEIIAEKLNDLKGAQMIGDGLKPCESLEELVGRNGHNSNGTGE